jgi:hypothetical protein
MNKISRMVSTVYMARIYAFAEVNTEDMRSTSAVPVS